MKYGNIYGYKRNRRPGMNLLGVLNLAVLLILLTLYLTGRGGIFGSGKAGDGNPEGIQASQDGTAGGSAGAGAGAAGTGTTGTAGSADGAASGSGGKASSGRNTGGSSSGNAPGGAASNGITAPFGGFVSNIAVGAGQVLEKGDPLFVLTDTSRVKITLQFNSGDAENIKAGQKAVVNLWDFMTSVDGVVTYVNSKPVYTPDGGKIVPVEIEVTNPGAIQKGMKADARVMTDGGSVKSLGAGSFDYIQSMTVCAPADGTLVSITLRENQYVNKGESLNGYMSWAK